MSKATGNKDSPAVKSSASVGSANSSAEAGAGNIAEKGGEEWCSAREQFFSELRRLLQDETLSEALWWQPRNGTIVISPRKFEKLVLPKYFRTRKFASFQRRLNRWGFRSHRCLTVQGDIKAYKNSDFHVADAGMDHARFDHPHQQQQPNNPLMRIEEQQQLPMMSQRQGNMRDTLHNLNASRLALARSADAALLPHQSSRQQLHLTAQRRRQVNADLEHMQRLVADTGRLREQRILPGRQRGGSIGIMNQHQQRQRLLQASNQTDVLRRQLELTSRGSSSDALARSLLPENRADGQLQSFPGESANNNALFEILLKRNQENEGLLLETQLAAAIEQQARLPDALLEQQYLMQLAGSGNRESLTAADAEKAALLRLELARHQERQQLLQEQEALIQAHLTDQGNLEAMLRSREAASATLREVPTANRNALLQSIGSGDTLTSLASSNIRSQTSIPQSLEDRLVLDALLRQSRSDAETNISSFQAGINANLPPLRASIPNSGPGMGAGHLAARLAHLQAGKIRDLPTNTNLSDLSEHRSPRKAPGTPSSSPAIKAPTPPDESPESDKKPSATST